MEQQRKRYRYQKSPLLEVIFQLRFPTILAIGAHAPADFQDLIRERFPEYNEGTEQQNELTIIPELSNAQLKRTETNRYEFITQSGLDKVSLSTSYIAISTLHYSQWENFLELINYVVPKFEQIYKPSFYSRVGLRYVDAITRSEYGLSDEKWNDLIKPNITGVMTRELEEGTNAYTTVGEFQNDDGTFIREHFEIGHINDSVETSFLLDCDYYYQSTIHVGGVSEAANILHNHSSAFIRSAITDKLHNAMGPVEII